MQFNPPQFYRPYNDAEDNAAGRARSNSSQSNTSDGSSRSNESNGTTDSTGTEDTMVSATTGSSLSSEQQKNVVGMDTGDTIDPRYELIRAAGPPLNDPQIRMDYHINIGNRNEIIKSLGYSSYPLKELPPFPKDSASLLQKKPEVSKVPELFSINSQNRDTNQYPYSSYFSLQLPRVYKNVVAFNVVQISFPTLSGVIPDNTSAINLQILQTIIPSFFNITSNQAVNYCEPQTNTVDQITEIINGNLDPTPLLIQPYNLCLAEATAACSLGVASPLDSLFIHEIGRFNPTNTKNLLKLSYTIPPGRYISSTIADALNQSMNSSMYFDIISYSSYQQKIKAGSGAIVLFPYALPYFYNNLTNIYTPTNDPISGRSQIASFYFPNINTMFSLPPTQQEIFVSYYYPVLKEVCINKNLQYLLNYGNY